MDFPVLIGVIFQDYYETYSHFCLKGSFPTITMFLTDTLVNTQMTHMVVQIGIQNRFHNSLVLLIFNI